MNIITSIFTVQNSIVYYIRRNKDDLEHIFFIITFKGEYNNGLKMLLSHTLHILMFCLTNGCFVRMYI